MSINLRKPLLHSDLQTKRIAITCYNITGEMPLPKRALWLAEEVKLR